MRAFERANSASLLGLKKQMPSTAIQYIAVSRKRLEVGELFEKVDLRKEIHLEHSCRSLARMEHYTSNASLARERILAAVMRSSRVFSR